MAISLAVPALAGLFCASLANYLADRLPRTARLAAWTCTQCGTTKRWGGYVLPRSCHVCRRPPGTRPWIVVAGMVILSLFTWLRPHAMGYPLGLLLLTYLVIVVVIDVEHHLILGVTSLFGAPLALGIGWRLHGVAATLAGAMGGLVIMGAFYWLGRWFARRRTERIQAAGERWDHGEALGAGDVTIAAILGLLLGWPLILLGLFLGILLGGTIGLIILLLLLVRGTPARRALMVFMPYGPGLVLGAFMIVFLPNLVARFLP